MHHIIWLKIVHTSVSLRLDRLREMLAVFCAGNASRFLMPPSRIRELEHRTICARNLVWGRARESIVAILAFGGIANAADCRVQCSELESGRSVARGRAARAFRSRPGATSANSTKSEAMHLGKVMCKWGIIIIYASQAELSCVHCSPGSTGKFSQQRADASRAHTHSIIAVHA